ncbi:hypothetical protein RvY_17300 [Ramazzottius varieornatus]|uniref:Pyrroloquinoline quinone-dependent pyranose dehydrogenase beta-propeller domain-containing protein n=1 Tax=Ramazzottius varieornatus TaxID=947166 RepID=A0A1D1W230_RAMVA|nr:hypothetical protein RvY_17300 [Ramazzottius varieornatus]
MESAPEPKISAVTANFVSHMDPATHNLQLNIPVASSDLAALLASIRQIKEQVNSKLTTVIQHSQAETSHAETTNQPVDEDDDDEEEEDYLAKLNSSLSQMALLLLQTTQSQVAFQAVTHFDKPVLHSIDPASLPPPFATESRDREARVVPLPADVPLTAPKGFRVNVFSGHDEPEIYGAPRQMVLAPNGDIFLTDMMRDQIHVLRDTNKDGVADQRFLFASYGLEAPFGLAFNGNYLYVGNVDEVVRFSYKPGQVTASGPPEFVVKLTNETRNFGHTTRNIVFSQDGTKFYVSVGSSGNVDIETNPIRAGISVYNADGSNHAVYASGIRNPVGLAFNPTTGLLWAAVNERDELGEDLVPDFVTSVRQGGFYGFPYSYLGQNVDPRIPANESRPDLVEKALVPDVLLTSHSAALGLAFYTGAMFPEEYKGDAFVALHGSWNRWNMTGYKIIRIKFASDGKPIRNEYMDFLTGWLPHWDSSQVYGRPVGILVNTDGSLLISDDGARKIWRLSYVKDNTQTSTPSSGVKSALVSGLCSMLLLVVGSLILRTWSLN